MIGTVVVGIVFGVITAIGLRWRYRRAETRLAQRREQLAAIVLYTEVTAAIDALDLALRAEDPKWLFSMSESTTLAEAWREHAEALTGLDSPQWDLLSDVISAVVPHHRLGPEPQPDDLRESLTERRQLLADTALMLETVHGRLRSASPTRHSSRSVALLA